MSTPSIHGYNLTVVFITTLLLLLLLLVLPLAAYLASADHHASPPPPLSLVMVPTSVMRLMDGCDVDKNRSLLEANAAKADLIVKQSREKPYVMTIFSCCVQTLCVKGGVCVCVCVCV